MGDEEPHVVREAGYVGNSAGPAQDTESYYKRTPAPGSRAESWEAPSERDTTLPGEPGWIPREQLLRDRVSTPGFQVPWRLVIGAAGLLGAMGIMAVGLVVLVVYSLSAEEPPPPAPPLDSETWQGLRVKKGLK